ncbi:MAG: ComF family protein [Clostridia bacterium]|nr:ComF family protein [Clostridia bacterium]
MDIHHPGKHDGNGDSSRLRRGGVFFRNIHARQIILLRCRLLFLEAVFFSKNTVFKLFKSLLDALFPRLCPICGKPSDRPERTICWDCFSSIDLYRESLCERCGRFAEGEIKHAFTCSVCLSMPPLFDKARAAGRFSFELRDLVHQLKYGGATWLASDLADFLEGCVTAHFPSKKIDVVLPVPLHPLRLRERTYNQASLLAEELAKRLDRRFDNCSLIRIRQTETQTHFNAKERRKNMNGAFSVIRPEWIQKRTVLLVDDVMTTGSTFDACAYALKKAGARTVWAVALARGQ